MQTVQTSLVMVGLNTLSPKVFWNGVEVSNIVDIATNWDTEEPKVKLRISKDSNISQEMRAAGIKIKIGEAR